MGPRRGRAVHKNNLSVENKVSVEMPSARFKTEYAQNAFPVKPTAVVIPPDRFM